MKSLYVVSGNRIVSITPENEGALLIRVGVSILGMLLGETPAWLRKAQLREVQPQENVWVNVSPVHKWNST